MKHQDLKVKDLEEFIKSYEVMYASVNGARLFVTLHAAPYHARYKVKQDGRVVFEHSNRGKAIREFNRIARESAGA